MKKGWWKFIHWSSVKLDHGIFMLIRTSLTALVMIVIPPAVLVGILAIFLPLAKSPWPGLGILIAAITFISFDTYCRYNYEKARELAGK